MTIIRNLIDNVTKIILFYFVTIYIVFTYNIVEFKQKIHKRMIYNYIKINDNLLNPYKYYDKGSQVDYPAIIKKIVRLTTLIRIKLTTVDSQIDYPKDSQIDYPKDSQIDYPKDSQIDYPYNTIKRYYKRNQEKEKINKIMKLLRNSIICGFLKIFFKLINFFEIY